MTTKERITTVKALKEFIKELPDDLEIDIYNPGSTGVVDECELEKYVFENGEALFYINIKAESGFY